MAGRGKGYFYLAQMAFFIPIQFGDFVIGNTPTLQMRLDTQRHIKMSSLVF